MRTLTDSTAAASFTVNQAIPASRCLTLSLGGTVCQRTRGELLAQSVCLMKPKAADELNEAPASTSSPAAAGDAPEAQEAERPDESSEGAGSNPARGTAAEVKPEVAEPPPTPSGFERFKRFWLTDLDGR